MCNAAILNYTKQHSVATLHILAESCILLQTGLFEIVLRHTELARVCQRFWYGIEKEYIYCSYHLNFCAMSFNLCRIPSREKSVCVCVCVCVCVLCKCAHHHILTWEVACPIMHAHTRTHPRTHVRTHARTHTHPHTHTHTSNCLL